MSSRLADVPQRRAARAAGIALLLMLVVAIPTHYFVLSGFIVEGDAAATVANIRANVLLFGIGIAGWLIVLVLDVVVALALYVVLKPVNRNLSLLTAAARLLYTAIMVISLGL